MKTHYDTNAEPITLTLEGAHGSVTVSRSPNVSDDTPSGLVAAHNVAAMADAIASAVRGAFGLRRASEVAKRVHDTFQSEFRSMENDEHEREERRRERV